MIQEVPVSTVNTVPVFEGAELRRGVSADGGPEVDNLKDVLPKGDYPALAQCMGGRYVDEHHHHNFWWVLLDTPYGRGWVNAVWIDKGGENEPIPGVKHIATVFERPETDGRTTPVHLVLSGAHLRKGGCAHNDKDNLEVPQAIPGGPHHTYAAIAQCGGEHIQDGEQFNFRWVLIETPAHHTGWVSEVYVKEGGNGAAIDGVPEMPTVNAIPPGLLP
jgi:hypothetical protein